MDKLIPILLIMSVLTLFKPVSLDLSNEQLYVVDVSAIEIMESGAERYVPDAEIALIDLGSGSEMSPQNRTDRGSTYAFYGSRSSSYRVEVNNSEYRVVDGSEFSLKKVKKYSWQRVYLKKSS